jgi:hypothetical protein
LNVLKQTKELAGVLLKDRRRYRDAIGGVARLANGDPGWVGLRNRNEHLVVNPDGPGAKCDWRWSSRLHACGVMPRWGQQLMRRVFDDWPIRFLDQPDVAARPQVSFLITHRGDDRLSQLRQVIRSVFAQRDVAVECVVVDLSPRPIGDSLPAGIVYEHVDTSHLKAGWYKAWAFNIAARKARGDILVFHDGDICAPVGYAHALQQQLVDRPYRAASIQRFLFYLAQSTTQIICDTDQLVFDPPVCVLQNWKGGTIAVRKDAFFEIGGFDEGFVDWGGEDDEFFSRCAAAGHLQFGYVPFIHLWHPSQPDRHGQDNLNETRVLPARLAIDVDQRVEQLTGRDFGNLLRPDPLVRYKDQIADRQRKTTDIES